MSFSPLAKEAMLHSIERRWKVPENIELPLDSPISEIIKIVEQEAQCRAAIKRVNDLYHAGKVKR